MPTVARGRGSYQDRLDSAPGLCIGSAMRKNRTCDACGAVNGPAECFCWRCGVEGAWIEAPSSATRPVEIGAVAAYSPRRVPVSPAIDEALGGGWPLVSALVSGAPGAGKSTFALRLAMAFDLAGLRSLYLSHEMGAGLVRAMVDRTVPELRAMRVWESPSVDEACDEIARTRPALVVLDSLQRSQTAANEALWAHMAAARDAGAALYAIAHATKEADIAGALGNQHDVDLVGMLERDESGAYLCVHKHRFGPAPVRVQVS